MTNHYGHNVDVTTNPFFCTDCDEVFDAEEQLSLNEEVDMAYREWLLGQYTTNELNDELERRGYVNGVLVNPEYEEAFEKLMGAPLDEIDKLTIRRA